MQMGRKFCLGRNIKNRERKQQLECKNKVGRPSKNVSCWYYSLHILKRPCYCLKISTILSLQESLSLPSGWVNQSKNGTVVVCTLGFTDSDRSPSVIKSLTVLPNYTWKVHVHGKIINVTECLALKEFPTLISSPSLMNRILIQLNNLEVCAGNPDDHFLQMADSRNGVFKNSANEVAAYVDAFAPISTEGVVHDRTIRTGRCEGLVKELTKCVACNNYRSTLRSLYSRWSSRQTSDPGQHTAVSSHTNYRYITMVHGDNFIYCYTIGILAHLKKRKGWPI